MQNPASQTLFNKNQNQGADAGLEKKKSLSPNKLDEIPGLKKSDSLITKPSGQTKLANDDQLMAAKLEFIKAADILKKGKIVKKYGQNALFGPGKRHIYMTQDNTSIAWKKQNTNKALKSFEISKLYDIKKGKESQNFQRFKKAKENLCLTIILIDRSIDIEAENETDYNELFASLQSILTLKKKYFFYPEFKAKT